MTHVYHVPLVYHMFSWPTHSRASRRFCLTGFHALRTLCPTCSRSSCTSCPTCFYSSYASCLTCSRVFRVLCPTRSPGSHALVTNVPRAFRALMPYVSRALHALIHHVLHALRALVRHMSYVLLYLTCLVPCVFSCRYFLAPYVLLYSLSFAYFRCFKPNMLICISCLVAFISCVPCVFIASAIWFAYSLR